MHHISQFDEVHKKPSIALLRMIILVVAKYQVKREELCYFLTVHDQVASYACCAQHEMGLSQAQTISPSIVDIRTRLHLRAKRDVTVLRVLLTRPIRLRVAALDLIAKLSASRTRQTHGLRAKSCSFRRFHVNT